MFLSVLTCSFWLRCSIFFFFKIFTIPGYLLHYLFPFSITYRAFFLPSSFLDAVQDDVHDPTLAPLALGRGHGGRSSDLSAVRACRGTLERMCRNIRTLHNFEPPATRDEVYAAAVQYVRKISGSSKPSAANQEAFDRAVAEIAHTTRHLLASLTTSAPPKNRDEEAVKARARSEKRYARA